MSKFLKKFLVLSMFGGVMVSQAEELPLVAVTQIVEHPSLDAIYQGVLDKLNEEGFFDGQTMRIEYEIAQGDMSIASQIAKKFAGENPAVIVAIATPSAQTAAAAARNTPIVFAAITDPLGAKLVSNLEKPGKNITGVSDVIPLDKQIELILTIKPDTMTIGTIYNPGEANSASIVKQLEDYLSDKPQSLLPVVATKSSEVLGAARSLVGKADVIFIFLDNTAASALEAVIHVGEQNQLPVFSADTDSVKRGTIAALGFDYFDVGRASGEYVVKILRGAQAGELSVGYAEKVNLVVNPTQAQKMGISLSDEILQQAHEVVGQ